MKSEISTNDYEFALELAGVGTWRADLSSGDVTASAGLFKLLGVEKNEGDVFRTLARGLHPEDREAVQREWLEAVRGKKPFASECRVMRPDGTLFWVSCKGEVQNGPDGKPVFLVGVLGRINDRARWVRAIQNERENFRNLFRQTPEMVCILSGPEHLFEFVNEAHVKVLGFDATGKTVREAQPESVEVHGILDDVYRTGVTARLHEIPVTVTGRLRHFNLTYAARRDDDGRINGIMILGTEITDRKKLSDELAKSREQYQLLFDSSPLPKWIVDPETFRFVNVNQAAIEHYGYSREEFLNMHADEIRPPEDRQVFREVMGRPFPTDRAVIHRMRHQTKDGRVREVEISAIDLLLDGKRLRMGAIFDVTERVASEKKQLELMNFLQAAKAEAEKANVLKSAFLANMSHEIRTPLGAMIGFADLLKDPGVGASERANYLETLIRNGQSLSVIIDDILDLSKVEAGHLVLEFTDADPSDAAADAISLLHVKAKEKGLALEFSCEESTPRTMVTDLVRVKQILLNLIGNAVKFTQFGSVKVRSYGCTLNNGAPAVCYEIKDTGIGIPLDKQDRIFEMFVQADGSTARKFGGTGLGLALSRRLAREMGGDVELVQSAPGEGTTFLVRVADLPHLKNTSSSPRMKERERDEPTADALSGVKVLVVDDSPDNQELIWQYLSRHGANVEVADDGWWGYRKALAGGHDIVLMDIQMPEMDGYTATQKLREAGYRKPIIALTAHVMSDVRQKCLNVGCNGHLPKPINPKQLISIIAEHTSPRES